MAISFVAAGTVSNGANPTVSVPAGVQAGDLLLLCLTNTTSVSGTTGWTQVAQLSDTLPYIYIWYKYASASESSISLGISSSRTRAVMLAYRGAGAHELVPVVTNGTGTTVTPNTVTTTYANDYIISFYACSFGTSTWTANGSTTSRVNASSTGTLHGFLIADELQTAVGVSTARAATLSSSLAWSSVAIAFIESGRNVYWRGGAGTWNRTNTTNWSNTSGGAGGVVPPSPWDNAIFNGSSGTGTVTVSNTNDFGCNDFTSTGSSALTFSGGSFAVYGNLTLGGSLNISSSPFVGTGIDFRATTTGKTITSAGKNLHGLTFNGAGGGWAFQDAASIEYSVTLTAGALNTNNQTITIISGSNAGFITSGSLVRSLTLGSSTINVKGANAWNVSGTNFTLNAGTSTINNTGRDFRGGGYTYNNYTHSTGIFSSGTIFDTNTFANVSITNLFQFSLGANQTITGTFTVQSGVTNPTSRLTISSDTAGTPRTITAAAVSIFGADFRDITGAGAASWNDSSRTGYWGDCKGNSGITFATGRTVYWNLAGTQNWSATGWALTSNGTPAAANFPLAQDTATFTDAGSAGTVTINAVDFNEFFTFPIGSLNMSGRTSAMTLAINSSPFVYGNWTYGSGVTPTSTGTRTITFSGRTTQTITSAGKTFAQNITIDSPSGTVQLLDNIIIDSARTLTLTNGTFNANNFNVSAGLFNSNFSNVRTLTMGSGTWTLSAIGSIWNLTTVTNLTFNANTSNIVLSAQFGAITFVGGGLTYNKLTLGNGTYSAPQVTITGSNTFNDISSNQFGGTLFLTASTTQTVANFTYGGFKESLYNVVYANLNSTTTAAANLTKSGGGTVNANYLRVSYVNVTPSNTWNALNSLSVIGTNSGWAFSDYSGNYGYTDAGVPIENKYVTKDYVMDYYPDLLPNFTTPQLFTWGLNNIGNLGDGTTTSRSSPGTTAGGGTNWKQVSIGGIDTFAARSFAAAIKSDGTLWTWGSNENGRLGTGNTTSRSSPGTTAGGGTNWKQVSCGYNHLCAIKTDGTLWTCGYNIFGALGDGTTTARSSFVTTAGGGTNWKQIAGGGWFTAAIKTDGTLWTWGRNSTGQVGASIGQSRESPGTTSGGGTNWKQVSCGYNHSGAIKTDGTLWTWGSNGSGRLGDGTTTDRYSPVTTAGGGTNWKQVATGDGHTAAIKTDGTLWTWGSNSSGELGTGNTTSRPSPGTTAGGGTNWKQVTAARGYTAAIKTDGTLWTWGSNGSGRLGDGTTTNRSSPGTVAGGGTNWKQVAIASGRADFLGAISESEGW